MLEPDHAEPRSTGPEQVVVRQLDPLGGDRWCPRCRSASRGRPGLPIASSLRNRTRDRPQRSAPPGLRVPLRLPDHEHVPERGTAPGRRAPGRRTASRSTIRVACRVPEQVLDLLGRRCVVDRERSRGEVQGRRIDQVGLGPVREHHRHGVPVANPMRRQPSGQRAHAPGVLPPGQRHFCAGCAERAAPPRRAAVAWKASQSVDGSLVGGPTDSVLISELVAILATPLRVVRAPQGTQAPSRDPRSGDQTSRAAVGDEAQAARAHGTRKPAVGHGTQAGVENFGYRSEDRRSHAPYLPAPCSAPPAQSGVVRPR